MNTRILLILLLALSVSACDRNPAELVPDNPPNVAVAYINNIQARRSAEGEILVPAAEMYNPNTNSRVASNNVRTEITASDERQVVEVAAILKQGENDAFGDVTYSETWRDLLTLDDDIEVFKNPFVFAVPFEGDDVGLVPASLEVVAKDNTGQENDPFSLDVQVDGSLAFLEATVPTTPQSGEFGIVGRALDPESGIIRLIAAIDGDEIFTYTLGDDEVPTFASKVNAEQLGNGIHFLTLYAVNGVNEAVAQDFPFNVFINDAPVAEDDTATTDLDTSVTIDVLANDSDEDGDTLTITAVTDPNNGTVQINGNALIVYTPNAGYEGTDSFFYTIEDVNSAVSSAQVTVQVGAEEAP